MLPTFGSEPTGCGAGEVALEMWGLGAMPACLTWPPHSHPEVPRCQGLACGLGRPAQSP